MAGTTSNAPAASTTEQKPRRRRFQFSLRTALLVMLLAGILFGGFAWRRDRAERQRRIVEALREQGATVEYQYFSLLKRTGLGAMARPEDEFFLCSWLRRCFGDDFVYDVDWVRSFVPPAQQRPMVELIQKLPSLRVLTLDGDGIRRQDLENLRCLGTVECLGLGSNTLPQSGLLTDDDLIPLERATRLKDLSLRYQPIGDAGISHLRNCRQLQSLTIMGTNITDQGLENLRELTEIRTLWLSYTRITDDGLKNFRDMNQLRFLELSHSVIRGPGLADIGSKPQLWYLNLSQTKVGDDDLRHMALFPVLKELLLSETRVTGSGLTHLKEHKKLTGIALGGCPVTDAILGDALIPDGWQVLNLSVTKVTDAGIVKLKLPSSINTITLRGTPVTDASLDHLANVPNLTLLNVEKTQVTPAGIKRFQVKNPFCEVEK